MKRYELQRNNMTRNNLNKAGIRFEIPLKQIEAQQIQAPPTDVAGIMLTNPNTLGLFEEQITEIAAAVHEVGGLLYYDGANLNAILGVVRPGDMGFDVCHLNLHKSFSTPHGGGGPGDPGQPFICACSSSPPKLWGPQDLGH